MTTTQRITGAAALLTAYKEGRRDFSRAYLRCADLSDADLSGAYLRDADLSGAYLRDADLGGADLSGADLSGAYLSRAFLRDADLSGAYLRGADLSGADLSRAYLRGADLRGAYLRGADLPSTSHDAIAEVLQREAHSVQELMVAGLVLIRREWCWMSFARELKEFPEERKWAADVLRKWPCFAGKVAEYEGKEGQMNGED